MSLKSAFCPISHYLLLSGGSRGSLISSSVCQSVGRWFKMILGDILTWHWITLKYPMSNLYSLEFSRNPSENTEEKVFIWYGDIVNILLNSLPFVMKRGQVRQQYSARISLFCFHLFTFIFGVRETEFPPIVMIQNFLLNLFQQTWSQLKKDSKQTWVQWYGNMALIMNVVVPWEDSNFLFQVLHFSVCILYLNPRCSFPTH